MNATNPILLENIHAFRHVIQTCGPTTGHAVRAVAFCDNEKIASELVNAVKANELLTKLAERVANLNPNAGEIGDGMLRQLVAQAKEALSAI